MGHVNVGYRRGFSTRVGSMKYRVGLWPTVNHRSKLIIWGSAFGKPTFGHVLHGAALAARDRLVSRTESPIKVWVSTPRTCAPSAKQRWLYRPIDCLLRVATCVSRPCASSQWHHGVCDRVLHQDTIVVPCQAASSQSMGQHSKRKKFSLKRGCAATLAVQTTNLCKSNFLSIHFLPR